MDVFVAIRIPDLVRRFYIITELDKSMTNQDRKKASRGSYRCHLPILRHCTTSEATHQHLLSQYQLNSITYLPTIIIYHLLHQSQAVKIPRLHSPHPYANQDFPFVERDRQAGRVRTNRISSREQPLLEVRVALAVRVSMYLAGPHTTRIPSRRLPWQNKSDGEILDSQQR